MLSIKGDADESKNGPCQWKVLYFHSTSLLTFVPMLGLGFGERFSPGCNVYRLVVDVAYGVLAPVTQRSVLYLEEYKRN